MGAAEACSRLSCHDIFRHTFRFGEVNHVDSMVRLHDLVTTRLIRVFRLLLVTTRDTDGEPILLLASLSECHYQVLPCAYIKSRHSRPMRVFLALNQHGVPKPYTCRLHSIPVSLFVSELVGSSAISSASLVSSGQPTRTVEDRPAWWAESGCFAQRRRLASSAPLVSSAQPTQSAQDRLAWWMESGCFEHPASSDPLAGLDA